MTLPDPLPTAEAPTLTEFLLARIAEDEVRARRFHPDEALHVHFSGDDEPTVLYTAARVLAECEAKRRIVGEHEPWNAGCCVRCRGAANRRIQGNCPTLQILGVIYSDHHDCRAEWKP